MLLTGAHIINIYGRHGDLESVLPSVGQEAKWMYEIAVIAHNCSLDTPDGSRRVSIEVKQQEATNKSIRKRQNTPRIQANKNTETLKH
jgi:hypothetical protein